MSVINILVDSNLLVSMSYHCWFFLKQLAERPSYHVIGAHQAPNKLGSVLGLFFCRRRCGKMETNGVRPTGTGKKLDVVGIVDKRSFIK